MKIVIPGGSGQIGSLLARRFHRDGHEVAVLSRHPTLAPWLTRAWDGRNPGPWCELIDGSDLVVNLAGYTVNCRYNKTNRDRIMQSRIDSTRAVGRAISQSAHPPHTWMQAGTATIYAHRYDADNEEESGVIGGNEAKAPDTWRFSIAVAKAWERAVEEADTPGTRKITLRAAMVMSPDRGGVFDVLLGLVRRGLGGAAGDGRQYVSWIHHQDFVQALYWLLERRDISGAVNIASPHPLPNSEFMRAIRQAWGIGIGLPASTWMLEIGALFMRTETELILKSRRVVPGRLLKSGFSFSYPNWPQAAEDLCRAWRAATENTQR